MTIPSSLAELRIPADSLRRLPAGAGYRNESGQAAVSLSMSGDTVVATARCDSLERLLFSLTEQLYAKGERDNRSEEQKAMPEATFGQQFKWCSTGILIGFILTILIQFIYKIWQTKQHP